MRKNNDKSKVHLSAPGPPNGCYPTYGPGTCVTGPAPGAPSPTCPNGTFYPGFGCPSPTQNCCFPNTPTPLCTYATGYPITVGFFGNPAYGCPSNIYLQYPGLYPSCPNPVTPAPTCSVACCIQKSCNPGQYMSNPNPATCTNCPTGTYTPPAAPGLQTSCTACPAGQSAPPGSTTCYYPTASPTAQPTTSRPTTPTVSPSAAPTGIPSYVASSSQLFSYTGAAQTFIVPAGVYGITISAYGAQGGAGYGGLTTDAGYGGYISTYVPVTPGQVLTLAVIVGGVGSGSTGGFGNGGAGASTSSAICSAGTYYGGGGGGASYVTVTSGGVLV